MHSFAQLTSALGSSCAVRVPRRARGKEKKKSRAWGRYDLSQSPSTLQAHAAKNQRPQGCSSSILLRAYAFQSQFADLQAFWRGESTPGDDATWRGVSPYDVGIYRRPPFRPRSAFPWQGSIRVRDEISRLWGSEGSHEKVQVAQHSRGCTLSVAFGSDSGKRLSWPRGRWGRRVEDPGRTMSCYSTYLWVLAGLSPVGLSAGVALRCGRGGQLSTRGREFGRAVWQREGRKGEEVGEKLGAQPCLYGIPRRRGRWLVWAYSWESSGGGPTRRGGKKKNTTRFASPTCASSWVPH